jgi:O-acetyl-ADP-ribose deacetylase (regulator of RNase III)
VLRAACIRRSIPVREITIGNGTLRLQRGDITRLGRHVGAIVNAANQSLVTGGGVCGVIHRVGGAAIGEACRRIGSAAVGSAVATTAGMLNADAVIHAVGPIWRGGDQQEDALLRSAYTNSLLVAEQRGLTSVAFPSISTGSFRFPIGRAAAIAIDAAADALAASPTINEIIFVLFSEADFHVYDEAVTAWGQEHVPC